MRKGYSQNFGFDAIMLIRRRYVFYKYVCIYTVCTSIALLILMELINNEV